MRRFLFGLAGALLFVTSTGFQQPSRLYTYFVNPSFDSGETGESRFPGGWSSRTGESTPDIMPGAWGLQCQPFSGKTCLGLVTRDDGSSEDMGQQLTKPLTANDCFTFSIYLAHAQKYVGFNQPVRLRIWGGNYPGHKLVLLDASPLINHSDWRQYVFHCTPSQTVTCITFEAYYAPGATFKYKGNILLDQLSQIDKCERA